MSKIYCIILILLLQGCIISRLERPRLTGYVFDKSDHRPIENCKFGENLTDSTGFFELKEKRYWELVILPSEAPTLNIFELVEKEGYISDTIIRFNMHGGGESRGAHLYLDTIFLKRDIHKL